MALRDFSSQKGFPLRLLERAMNVKFRKLEGLLKGRVRWWEGRREVVDGWGIVITGESDGLGQEGKREGQEKVKVKMDHDS